MLRSTSLLLVPALLAITLPSIAAEKSKRPPPAPAFIDPTTAGPDFQIQGEYVGVISDSGSETTIGAQIVALGDGKFHGLGYVGGLPGDGWNRIKPEGVDLQAKDGVVSVIPPDGPSATIKDGLITIKDGDRTLGTLKKVVRKSPTLGAKPPAGAIVLFDGTTADNFIGGRMTPDSLLMEGATSKQKFQSYSIHLEFLVPFMPTARGQARGNSGAYCQGRYEVQILDSFGLESKNNECGGIYGVAAPEINMSYPPLSWQTYDVDYTAAEYKDGKKVHNARITVRHNGVQIHKDCEVPHATTAAPVKEGPEPGPVFLQNHGNPVRFRNIWVVLK